MPTTRGWAALGAGIALTILWVVFGERLMLGAGLFLVLAVGGGIGYVRTTVPRVGVTRRLTPFQVHDGDRAVVEVTLLTGRRIAQATILDEVSGLGTARFVADRIEPQDPMTARYEILCRSRGIYAVGPAIVQVRDPLELTEAGGTAGKVDRLVVYPAIEDLDGLPLGRGHDPTVNTSKSSFSQTDGEDFFTLREYQQGDDLRKVHWPSTAKRDILMIRQLEMPWQSRALVLLDIRADSYTTPESFEHAVRGAASAMRHLYRHGFNPTLWSGSARGTPVSTTQGYELAMEELATVMTNPDLDFGSLMGRLRREGLSGGALVMVTGVLDSGGVSVFKTLSRDYYKTVVMTVSERENEALHQVQRAGAVAVTSGPASKWAPAWREAMEKTWSTASAG